MTNDFHST